MDTIGFNHKTRFLEQLWNCSAETASRILIVSRDDADIRSFVRSARLKTILLFEYYIVPSDTNNDVGSFSTNIVNKRLKVNKNESFIDEIAQEATRRSGGMFLWVRFLERLLSPGKNRNQLRKAVLEMPEGLEQTYRRELQMVSDLNSEEKERAIAILRWAYFAPRPLTVRELTEALITDINSSSTYPFDDLPDTWDEYYVNDQIRKLCGSLIEIRGSTAGHSIATQTVHFVHSSVKEFLSRPVRSDLNWNISFSQAASEHALLAKVCLSYICYDDIMKEYKSAEKDLQKKIDCFHFLPYAAQMWLFHLSLSGEGSKDLTSLIKKLFDPATSRWVILSELFETSNESFDVLDPETKFDPPTPLYYAALTGLSETLEWLLSLGVGVNASGGRYGNALQAAAAKGHKEALKILLINGADVNKHGGKYSYAILAAADKCSSPDAEEIVKLLAEAGADTANHDTNGMSALQYAAKNGSKRIVGLLLRKRAEVNAADVCGMTALSHASHGGHESVVRLLIEHGANVNANYCGWTPLHDATAQGHRAVIQLLIEHGADVNANNCGWTPLHVATAQGHRAVIQLLIEQGADVNAKLDGWTPLHDATIRGCRALVQLLIEQGADVNAKLNGSTPLHIAARKGHQAVVQLLINNGAEVNTADQTGRTALHLAVENSHDNLVRFLIENGAEVNAGGHTSQTPLHFAIYRGMAEIAWILLSLEGDPTTLDCYGRTYIDWVSNYKRMRDILSGYISDYCPTDPAISSDILRHSIVNLATELRDSTTKALFH
jgi:ankyrin repeat protein